MNSLLAALRLPFAKPRVAALAARDLRELELALYAHQRQQAYLTALIAYEREQAAALRQLTKLEAAS